MLVNRGTEEGKDLQHQRTQVLVQGIEATALGSPRWRVSPEPFWIHSEEAGFFRDLGNHLLSFYQALNHLYHESVHGHQPPWVTQYLDQGKPPDLVAYGRMNRIKSHLPGIIRPDIILTETGRVCTELDSVPGGFGITGLLAQLYTRQGHNVIGGSEGIVRGFARMIQGVAGKDHPALAVVVSEESRDYLPEMQWLGEALRSAGFAAYVVGPGEVEFTEAGFFIRDRDLSAGDLGRRIPIDVIYRFFELFDLKNIPKSELFLYGAKKDLVAMTPPVKAFLEEKMCIALFHHPVLRPFWLEALGKITFDILEGIFPKTWILDPKELPPYGVIPALVIGDRWITDWRALGHLSQRDRHWVIKPSGFSELAWGSRGVTVGHDESEQDWQHVIEMALRAFDRTPYILQVFHKGRQAETSYYDVVDGVIKKMSGRARLTPYYFVVDGKAELAGILATICPLDKKLLHGMVDAVMAPCGLRANP